MPMTRSAYLVTELRDDQRTPVSTLGGKPFVPEDILHQCDPHVCSAPVVDTRCIERQREALAWQRWYDDIEGIRRIATKCCGIREWANHLVQIPERPRPAVVQDNGHRPWAFAWLVNEMNRDILDGRLIVSEAVHLPFVCAPVVLVNPIVHQFFE